jgi:hypothetical protein
MTNIADSAAKPRENKASKSKETHGSVPAKRERIKQFMRLMADGKWVKRITAQEFADDWGMRIETIEREAAESSRRLTETVESSEEIREMLCITLQVAVKDLHRLATVHSIRNPRTAVAAIAEKVRAIEALAGISGAKSATKVTVGGDLAGLFSLAYGDGTKPE